MKLNTKRFALIAALLLLADRGLAGCTAAQAAETAPNDPAIYSPAPTAGNSYTDNTDGGHAILTDDVHGICNSKNFLQAHSLTGNILQILCNIFLITPPTQGNKGVTASSLQHFRGFVKLNTDKARVKF